MNIGTVGIEFNMRGDAEVKTFYNIRREKNWILSAMDDDENKGKITDCQLYDNFLAKDCLMTALRLLYMSSNFFF